ncbi:MFS transporter [Paenibacillus aceris]|uniref:DHA1 family multidrug resistance protein-like MFS transporter n=1 Tax=Paenibacillus aceris TaxID=869555 RepID=A0ABS4I8A7_9BACL|nr:DHA1 family multidrug resistance protein-like MFS transporter [Paenibacillus aceris]NHW38989.1 multidrug efflux MFS transporter [Paenibacillus aceris]
MENWKRNLFILYVGQFLAMASTSSITPFLPLYLQDLGLTDPKKVLFWSGMIYGANLLTAFLFSPLWGKLADKYGRKVMLVRSGIGMAVTITLMGVATSPVHLLLLRLVNGVLSGFGPAAIALTATNTPKERSGYALGILHSGAVAGTICGPLLGGLMADHFGLREVFFYTGISIFVAALVVIFGVKETFEKKERTEKKTDMIQDFKMIVSKKPIASLFVSSAILRAAMIGTLPLIPLYVQQLSAGSDNLVVLAGITSAAMGIANMITAPHLGKLGDKFGSHRIFIYAVFGAIVFSIPQAFVHQLWQLIVLRFCTGACIGGMMPSMNVLIRQYAPAGMESRTYSYVNCAVLLGGLAGSLGMGAVASSFGLPMIFICAAALLIISNIWMKVKVFPHIMQRKESAVLAGGQEIYK